MLTNLEFPSLLPFQLSQLFSTQFSHRVPAVLNVSVDGDVKTYHLSASPLLPHICDGSGACGLDGDDDGSTTIAQLVAFSRPRYLAHISPDQPRSQFPLHLFSVSSHPHNVVLFSS